MFESSAFSVNQSLRQLSYSHADRTAQAAASALELYRSARWQAWLKGIWSSISRTSRSLDTLEKFGQVKSRGYAGVRTVSIRQIRGSESRIDDFDADFNPLRPHNKSRWVNIARLRLQGQPLPPVELIQVGEKYFVRDGHHRISVARKLGEEAIEAEVTVWQVNERPNRRTEIEPSQSLCVAC